MTLPRRSAVIAGTLLLLLTACANPSFIGVQDFGTVYGNAISSTGQPITGALVSASGTTSTISTAANGSFNLTNVAVGEQTVTVRSPGYSDATADVIVTKNMSVNAGNLTLTAQTSTPVNH